MNHNETSSSNKPFTVFKQEETPSEKVYNDHLRKIRCEAIWRDDEEKRTKSNRG